MKFNSEFKGLNNVLVYNNTDSPYLQASTIFSQLNVIYCNIPALTTSLGSVTDSLSSN